MRPKHVFAILLLASLGLAAVLFLRARHDTVAAAAAAPAIVVRAPQREVLAAVRPLTAGLLLRAQDVTWREREKEPRPGQVVRPSAEERATKPESDEAAQSVVYGAALRTSLTAGEAIRLRDIVKPGDRDFLQTVLKQGTRALTIPITAAAGGTGLMFPGDHVDVMLTQSFKNEEAPLTRRSVSETVVEDLRVLALDRNAKPQPGAPAGAITVTLEVLPQQAEKINVAQELGKLSLTLRSLDEPADQEKTDKVADVPPAPPLPPPAPTWAGDVSPALQAAQPPAKVIQAERPAIKVMRGKDATDTRLQ